jgi:hypothetical protein
MDRRVLLWVAPLLLLLATWELFLTASYPLIGHDYTYVFPRLLAGVWHFTRQGFWPFWWVPHLCGGLPQYGNPHDYFYSLPQFLVIAGMDLWSAMRLSTFFFLILGYIGWVRVGRDVLRVDGVWAHLLALIVVASGYHFLHSMVGHLSFQPTPLLGWIVWILFDHAPDTLRSLIVRALGMAAIAGYCLYSGANFVLIQAAIFIAFLFLFMVVIAVERWGFLKMFFIRVVACGIATLALAASKLVAVWSVMRFFPRHTELWSLPEGETALPFMFKAIFGFPQRWQLYSTPKQWHEYGQWVSPVVVPGLLAAGLAWWRRARCSMRSWVLGFLILFTVAFFLQLSAGGGWIVTSLQSLPVFSSLRVATRFLLILALLMAMCGIWGLHACFDVWKGGVWKGRAAAILSFSTVVLFYGAFVGFVHSPLTDRPLDYARIKRNIQQHADFVQKTPRVVEDFRGQKISDVGYLTAGTVGVECYEPLLAGNTFLTPLVAGSVEQVIGGTYNINNPACLMFPEENGCKPGDRIALDDRANMEKFLAGEATTWRMSHLQRVANVVTLVALLFGFSCIVYAIGEKVRRRFVR